jgi:hypothetical protein
MGDRAYPIMAVGYALSNIAVFLYPLQAWSKDQPLLDYLFPILTLSILAGVSFGSISTDMDIRMGTRVFVTVGYFVVLLLWIIARALYVDSPGLGVSLFYVATPCIISVYIFDLVHHEKHPKNYGGRALRDVLLIADVILIQYNGHIYAEDAPLSGRDVFPIFAPTIPAIVIIEMIDNIALIIRSADAWSTIRSAIHQQGLSLLFPFLVHLMSFSQFYSM